MRPHIVDPRGLGRRVRQALQGSVPLKMPPWEIYLFILPAFTSPLCYPSVWNSTKICKRQRGVQTMDPVAEEVPGFYFYFIYRLPLPNQWLESPFSVALKLF